MSRDHWKTVDEPDLATLVEEFRASREDRYLTQEYLAGAVQDLIEHSPRLLGDTLRHALKGLDAEALLAIKAGAVLAHAPIVDGEPVGGRVSRWLWDSRDDCPYCRRSMKEHICVMTSRTWDAFAVNYLELPAGVTHDCFVQVENLVPDAGITLEGVDPEAGLTFDRPGSS